ncbi:hypothetical protein CEN49_00845, partial [Fischerella thermalis CCMEE 5273]
MKRRWKSLFLAVSWVMLAIGTSILIILTQPLPPTPAQEPTVVVETPKPTPTPETSDDKKPDSAAEPAPTPEEIARRQ